ncbi:uncharacterized protein BX663DRAFT_434041 [Cokeromyces recurvatus]|uniref:uncharacterized protein n=1 Tax=Cokeromyces recurvatus TaxID=90255 RepID=UPI00221EEED3|nr:uncharacterized protein BX663DRAFT_434041 [Cokeromyces recurvatus]KAI7903286.1 hypothetical protein BX663DRAFT_434041 [Cokeromyces recurvatus]
MHYLSLVKIKEKKRLIAGLGDLKPVAYIDHEGKEHSLLAASKVIDSLTSSQKKKERKRKNSRYSLPLHQKKKRNNFGEEIETNPSPSIRNVIYSRLPSLDAHYEKTSTTKGNFSQCSLPYIDTRYLNVELCLMNADRSQKLVLGTKTMNVLITSSIRIDCDEKSIIGPSSSNGFLPSRETQYLLKKQKLKRFKE